MPLWGSIACHTILIWSSKNGPDSVSLIRNATGLCALGPRLRCGQKFNIALEGKADDEIESFLPIAEIEDAIKTGRGLSCIDV